MRIGYESIQFDRKNIFFLLRPDQYVKNTFIFLPLFFGLKIANFDLLLKAILAFVTFSLISSAVYIFNDLYDIDQDRLHPTKQHRPLASGAITQSQSIALMSALFILGIALSCALPSSITAIVLAYVALNALYTLYFKHLPILDVTIVAICFVIRIFTGSSATGVPLSEWIIVMTFLLALFLALAKRRDDVRLFADTGNKMRRVVDSYSLQFLDISIASMASVVIVAYIVYTTSAPVAEDNQGRHLYLTSIFVILGILRYLQFVFVLHDAGNPTKIVLKDRFMQSTILCWGLSFVFMLY